MPPDRLAISLTFGILVSALLTLVVIPLLLLRRLPQPPFFPHPARSMTMRTWKIVHTFAGSFILLSLVFGVPGSLLFTKAYAP